MLQDYILHVGPDFFWFYTNMQFSLNIASVLALQKWHGFTTLNAYFPILICS